MRSAKKTSDVIRAFYFIVFSVIVLLAPNKQPNFSVEYKFLQFQQFETNNKPPLQHIFTRNFFPLSTGGQHVFIYGRATQQGQSFEALFKVNDTIGTDTFCYSWNNHQCPYELCAC